MNKRNKSQNLIELDKNLEYNTPVLFKNKINKDITKPFTYSYNDVGRTKHFSPAAQEWFNSVYSYNHNNIKSLPVADNNMIKLLKSYFNFQLNQKITKRKYIATRYKRLFTKKIFVGRGDLKHTSDKVTITFYVYNAERISLYRTMRLFIKALFYPEQELSKSVTAIIAKNKEEIDTLKSNGFSSSYLFSYVIKMVLYPKRPVTDRTKLELNFIRVKLYLLSLLAEKQGADRLYIEFLRHENCALYLNTNFKKEHLYKRYLEVKKIFFNIKETVEYNRPLSLKEFLNLPYHYKEGYYDFVISNVDVNNLYLKNIISYYKILKKLVSLKVISQEKLSDLFFSLEAIIPELDYPKYSDYKRLIKHTYLTAYKKFFYLFKFNKVKFTDPFISNLTRLVEKMYQKKVIFNIVSLKKMHLNSDIYTQVVSLKLRDRKNQLYRILRASLRKVKLPDFSRVVEKFHNPNKNLNILTNKIRNKIVVSMFNKENVKDPLSNLVLNLYPSANDLNIKIEKKYTSKVQKFTLSNYIFKSLKRLNMRGIRVEGKGRLTRRHTAARSVFNLKWKGGLRNVDSSFKGLSTPILRGHFKSNIQYSFISSKTRNGAFGIKGWVSNR